MDTIMSELKTIDRVFYSLPPKDRVEVFSIGAAFHRLDLEKRLTQAMDKVQAFEARYHTTISQLEADGLPDDADYTMHEDYIEWHYWSRMLKQTRKAMNALVTISPILVTA